MFLNPAPQPTRSTQPGAQLHLQPQCPCSSLGSCPWMGPHIGVASGFLVLCGPRLFSGCHLLTSQAFTDRLSLPRYMRHHTSVPPTVCPMASDPSMALTTVKMVFVLFASPTRRELPRMGRASLVYCFLACVCTRKAMRMYLFMDGGVDGMNYGTLQTWVQISVLPGTSSLNWSKSFKVSGPSFPGL